MSSTDVTATEETEITECDGEKVVTMMDVLQEQQEFEEDANAVLGASDDKNCTYPKGYIKRQAIYACLTCCSEAKTDPTKRAGVCLACSLSCHENHELVELYTKRNFCCDCGNPKFNSHPCQFLPNKPDMNENNSYNQNFSGLYCTCHRPYPDPEATFEDEMIQCIVCEDWLHASHLEATVPPNDVYAEMICKGCMQKNEFLYDYSNFAVNVDTEDDVEINVTETSIVNGSGCNGIGNCDKEDVDVEMSNAETEPKENSGNEVAAEQETEKPSHDNESVQNTKSELIAEPSHETTDAEQNKDTVETSAESNEGKEDLENKNTTQLETNMETNVTNMENKDSTDEPHESSNTDEKEDASTKVNDVEELKTMPDNDAVKESANESETNTEAMQKPIEEQSTVNVAQVDKMDTDAACEDTENNSESVSEKDNCDAVVHPISVDTVTEKGEDNNVAKEEKSNEKDLVKENCDDPEKIHEIEKPEIESTEHSKETTATESEKDEPKVDTADNEIKDDVLENIDKLINDTEDTSTEKDDKKEETTVTNGITSEEKLPVNKDVENNIEMEKADNEVSDSVSKENDTIMEEKTSDNKRKLDEVPEEAVTKKPKLDDAGTCIRPKDVKKKFKGAVFWPHNFRQKLCTCNECITMYKDLSILFLMDLEDTVTAYETLGKQKTEGMAASQYEKGLEALSSLDRIQQINALTEYNNMRDKLLEFLKSFKDRKEIVKEEDIKAFFAGMKPKREPDGVYFCR